jgi:hypothetical protein
VGDFPHPDEHGNCCAGNDQDGHGGSFVALRAAKGAGGGQDFEKKTGLSVQHAG